VSAIGDGGNVAFVSLLEVLPPWRGRGIGRELMHRMLARLADRYAVDLVCDDELVPFYEALGGTPARAMLWRNRPDEL
jgi:GNAT superfamily N-acetyltransferase